MKDLSAYDGFSIDNLERIPEISYYNNNYYVGTIRAGNVEADLLYGHSDDDFTTEWYLVEPYNYLFIGYSYCNKEKETIQISEKYT